jgi:ribosome-binding factor A
MKRKQPSRKDFLSSCSEVGPEDGADPRLFFRKASAQKHNRKALQLCGAVTRALSHALAWELGDELLSSLRVESVTPAPDSSRLLVVVSIALPPDEDLPDEMHVRLRRLTGRLRAEVATAIHRRRVPELSFFVQARKEVEQ